MLCKNSLDQRLLQAYGPCQLAVTGATGFLLHHRYAVVVQKVGPVKARFTGVVTLSDMVPGQSLRISGEGKGGPAGFAKGGANVTFTAIPEGTRLSYDVEANVGGKIAQLGSRLIDGFAKKMADEFFERFQQTIEGPGEPADESAEGDDPEGGEKKKGWLKRIIG